jgi:hypothetical protein
MAEANGRSTQKSYGWGEVAVNIGSSVTGTKRHHF